MGLVKEFKEFIARGSVIDMAVGVVIGGAFASIVDSLVSNIIMPVLGVITAGIDFSELRTVLVPAAGDTPAVVIQWGLFIESIISFLLIALVIFLMLKAINKLRENAAKLHKAQEEVEAAAQGPTESDLLADILLELKKQNGADLTKTDETATAATINE